MVMCADMRRTYEAPIAGLLVPIKLVAKAAGLPRRRVRDVLARAGATIRFGGVLYTTRHKLRELHPELWDEVRDRLAEVAESDDETDGTDES